MLIQKTAASRGWCEPGVSMFDRKSLRSFNSEARPWYEDAWAQVGTDGNSPVKGNMYRQFYARTL